MRYANSAQNMFIYRGIIGGCAANIAVTVFQGTQPTASDITANWTNARANYLQHWTGGYWSQPNANTLGSGNLCTLGVPLTPRTANATGTASWGIIWASNVAEASVQSGTLPNANFIVGPVTDVFGNGMIKMNSTSTTSGSNASSVTDAVISITIT